MPTKPQPAIAGMILLIAGVVIAMILFTQNGAAQKPPAQGDAFTDPQMLMIPRWFLSNLTLNGQQVAVEPGQQTTTIQFAAEGKANGKGGCNNFSTSYQAGPDGKLSFSPVVSTKMACPDSMVKESAYFEALSKVQQFKIEDGKLILSSSDGKTSLVFVKPRNKKVKGNNNAIFRRHAVERSHYCFP